MSADLHQTAQARYRWKDRLSEAVLRTSNYQPRSGSALNRTSRECTGNLAPDPTSPAPRPHHRWLKENEGEKVRL